MVGEVAGHIMAGSLISDKFLGPKAVQPEDELLSDKFLSPQAVQTKYKSV